MPGTSVDSGETTQSGDTLIEVSSNHCWIRFDGHLICLGGKNVAIGGTQKSRSAMEQEPVGTYLVKKTRKGKLIGAMIGTKMSPRQASVVKEIGESSVRPRQKP
jgi:hypothetical protein